MKKIMRTGLCALAIALAAAPVAYAGQTYDAGLEVKSQAIFRKKEKDAVPQETPVNAPAAPERTTPAETEGRGGSFVDMADVNRPFYRHNLPGTTPSQTTVAPVSIPGEVAPTSPNAPATTVPATAPSTTNPA